MQNLPAIFGWDLFVFFTPVCVSLAANCVYAKKHPSIVGLLTNRQGRFACREKRRFWEKLQTAKLRGFWLLWCHLKKTLSHTKRKYLAFLHKDANSFLPLFMMHFHRMKDYIERQIFWIWCHKTKKPMVMMIWGSELHLEMLIKVRAALEGEITILEVSICELSNTYWHRVYYKELVEHIFKQNTHTDVMSSSMPLGEKGTLLLCILNFRDPWIEIVTSTWGF